MNNDEIKHNNQSILLAMKKASWRKSVGSPSSAVLVEAMATPQRAFGGRTSRLARGELSSWKIAFFCNANILVTPLKTGSQTRRFYDQ